MKHFAEEKIIGGRNLNESIEAYRDLIANQQYRVGIFSCCISDIFLISYLLNTNMFILVILLQKVFNVKPEIKSLNNQFSLLKLGANVSERPE